MFNYQDTVQFEDVDSYGIAHHTKIIAYLERARVHFIISKGIDINNISYGVVLTNLNINFKRPLLMLDKFDVEVRIKKLENVRFEWFYKIIKDNKVVIEATIEQVVIDLDSKKVIQMPDEFTDILESILIKS